MTHAQATQRFYAHIYPLRAMLLRTASFLASSSADAEDLVQETLMKAFKAIDSFDLATNPQPWLCAILRNTRIDRARAAARSPGGGAPLSLDQTELEIAQTPVDSGVQSLAASLDNFSDQTIIDALKRLPEDIRWTLLLVDIQQLDYHQAAGILDIPPGTVKSRLHRGRLMLKNDLLAHGLQQPQITTTRGAS